LDYKANRISLTDEPTPPIRTIVLSEHGLCIIPQGPSVKIRSFLAAGVVACGTFAATPSFAVAA
jgi:hypothetical protein